MSWGKIRHHYRVWSLVRGASTCREATKPVSAPVAAHLGPQQWPQCMEELVHCAQAWKPSSQHAGEKRGVAGLLLGLTLCDPIDGSPPGCPVHGILQARTLEWVAISSSNA